MRSLATLAYDCRRSEFFRNELMSALKIINRGDMSAGQLRGGWAGEIGPMQFLPSSYYKYAVDFDGDGRKDWPAACPTCSPRPPTTSRHTAGAPGRVGRRLGELRRAARVEQGGGLRPHHFGHGRPAGGRTAAAK